jgi:hypothetical protein
MPRSSAQVLIVVFIISIALHLFIQHKISQCRRATNRNFVSSCFAAGWPYTFAFGFVKYGLPHILLWLGFGPLGILPRSIAAWIQSIYGVSSLFSLFQSIGARGGVTNTLRTTLDVGTLLNAAHKLIWGRDYVAECIKYYESWLALLNMFDCGVVICYTAHHLITRRQ